MNLDSIENEKILITSALPYVNNVPHLGNVVGCVLSADVYYRFLKIYYPEKKVLFVGGVDEYGTASEMKARQMGISCKELCDMNYNIHKTAYDWFLIDFDCYGRTSQPNGDPKNIQTDWSHTKITHEIFKSLVESNYVIEKKENVMYCKDINSYVADRYIIGKCPKCKSDANGDQCDTCQSLLNPSELIDARYKLNSEYKLETKTTENLYIDIPKIWKEYNMTKKLEEYENTWTKNALTITKDWIRIGLLPRSISRDLYWGTKVPDTDRYGDKYSEKVFYVWFDAPIGYISITDNSLSQNNELNNTVNDWWKSNNVKLVQFMAKDNVPFHSIIFPATLYGSGYSKFKNHIINSTEYLMYEGQKFSKSNNKGLFCDDVIKISEKYNLPSDYWRAYLIYIRPETTDSNFVLNGDTGFVGFINNILLKNIGNLVQRVLSLAFQVKKKLNILKLSSKLNDDLSKDLNNIKNTYILKMNSAELRDSFKKTLEYSSRLNLYVNNTEPWNIIKKIKSDNLIDDKNILSEVLCSLLFYINELSFLISPIMPNIANKIRTDKLLENNETNNITYIMPDKKPEILIKPVEKIEYAK